MCSLDFGEIACNKCPVLLLLLLKLHGGSCSIFVIQMKSDGRSMFKSKLLTLSRLLFSIFTPVVSVIIHGASM